MADQTGDVAEQYDLLPRMIPNLDRHLVFPLIQFVAGPEEEQTDQDQKIKYELLKTTNMIDYIGSLHADINNLSQPADEFNQKREAVLQKREQLEEDTSKILGLLDEESVINNLRSDKTANLNYLKDNHGVTNDMVDKLFEFGQFQYSCGDYDRASELLYRFRVLSTDNDKVSESTWGKLASNILTTDWEAAMEEVTKVKESIDTRLFSAPLAQLQHRTFLIHWSLFPFFNHEPARDTLTELFFSPAYINTIQASCPWILRYLAAAVITNRSRSRTSNQYQKQLKDLIRIVKQEGYEYSDPVTDFIKALYIDFDFEEAQKKLGEAEEVLRRDFFLVATADAFVDAARHLISESYCKIHQRIDIKYAATPETNESTKLT